MTRVPSDVRKALNKLVRVRKRRKDGHWQRYWVVTAPEKGVVRFSHITSSKEKPELKSIPGFEIYRFMERNGKIVPV